MKTAKKKEKVLVIGIDPGTGVNSPMGLAIFDPEAKRLLWAEDFWTEHKKLEHRIKDISERLETRIIEQMALAPDATYYVFIESFVMRGKGGETLQRMIGSVMGRVPYHVELGHVQNSTIKLLIAGHGHASKELVAEGVEKYFRTDASVPKLIAEKAWYKIDAIAIGLTGWLVKFAERGAK